VVGWGGAGQEEERRPRRGRDGDGARVGTATGAGTGAGTATGASAAAAAAVVVVVLRWEEEGRQGGYENARRRLCLIRFDGAVRKDQVWSCRVSFRHVALQMQGQADRYSKTR
jgi:hypothetical protein